MKQQVYITDYVAKNAHSHPQKLALICSDRRLTWHELEQEVDIVTAFLLERITSREQQVIGLLLPNSWQFVVAYLAILRSGHIALPLDPNFKKQQTESITEQVSPVLTITNTLCAHELPDAFETIIYDATTPQAEHKKQSPAIRLGTDKQIASLLFTSGTTGKPKVTAYTHANHIWNISAVSDLWQWTARDTLLLSLPLSHWHGLVMGIAGALYHGNTIYLHERFTPEATIEALQNGTISLFMHVPIAYFKLVEYAGDKKFDISKVRLCISGSSYLPPSIWQAFKSTFGQEILERYGSSETGLIASNSLHRRQPGIVGTILPGVDVRVEKDGELAMRSSGRFAGYYKNEEATKKNTTPDGWWLTGDIGEFNEAGELRLKGRLQEKIKKLGYTVYPRDVEWALLRHSHIHDAVAVGIQKPETLNDTMVHFVVSPLPEEEIRDFCKQNLPAAWRPDKIIKLHEIPKTRSGKPRLALLRDMV